jgi:hypothetical protein
MFESEVKSMHGVAASLVFGMLMYLLFEKCKVL